MPKHPKIPKNATIPGDDEEIRRIARKLSHGGLDEFVAYLRSPWRIIWANLLAGIFRGLGFVLGATVVLAIATTVLVNWLGSLPWVGDFFREMGSFVQQVEQASQNLGQLGK